MSNLIVVTLPTMHFRRAPETRNLFATRRLYIYIYYHCQFYRFVSSRERFHRGKSCYRCYAPPSPYPKVTSPRGTPLSLSIYIYIHRFVSTPRRDSHISFSSSQPILETQTWILEETSRFISLAKQPTFQNVRRFESWKHGKKGTGRRKERRRRKSEVLTGGAKQFDPPDANFGDAKLPVTARNDRAKKSYGG